jgi:hypothetical protein
MSKFNFLCWQSLTRTRILIRIVLVPWIRIRIETSAATNVTYIIICLHNQFLAIQESPCMCFHDNLLISQCESNRSLHLP